MTEQTKTKPLSPMATRVLAYLDEHPSDSQADIAKAVGTSRTYVNTILAQAGRPSRIHAYTARARQLYRADNTLTPTAIARKIGATDSTVSKALVGLKPKAKPRPSAKSVAQAYAGHIGAIQAAWKSLLTALPMTDEIAKLASALADAITGDATTKPTNTQADGSATVEPTPPASIPPDADAPTDAPDDAPAQALVQAPAQALAPDATPADICLDAIQTQLQLRASPPDDSDNSILATITGICNTYLRDHRHPTGTPSDEVAGRIASDISRWQTGTAMPSTQLDIIANKIRLYYD